MHRRPHHKSLGSLHRVDNTFRRELLPSAHFRTCNNFAKQEQLQRGYHEFEDGNQRRLIKRQQSDSYQGSRPRYRYASEAMTSYTARWCCFTIVCGWYSTCNAIYVRDSYSKRSRTAVQPPGMTLYRETKSCRTGF